MTRIGSVATGDLNFLSAAARTLVDQICAATGGPCKYTGKDMVTAHKGMNITDAEFNALGGMPGKGADCSPEPAIRRI